MAEQVAFIIGAGDALGGAIARAFAAEGYTACVARRDKDALSDLVSGIEDAGGKAVAYGLDATDEGAVAMTFDEIEADVGPLGAVVYNPGAFLIESILDLSLKQYREIWEVNNMGGFLVGREAARRMVKQQEGTILFTGATASMRGGAKFGAFASAKAGLRALAQSMARELGQEGIHVAHVVVDGIIDSPAQRERFGAMIKDKPEPALMHPDDIARNYVAIHDQPRSAWTFEIDLRPWAEKW
jgi:NAD(P)-dependent dehydrogenase (short-subunit alcohol dehydrogenase family)